MKKVELSLIGKVPEIIAQAGRPVAAVYARFFATQTFKPNTRQAYQSAADQFLNFLSQRGTRMEQVSPADAEAFFVAIASKSPSGQRQTLSALRALFGAFLDAHLIAENPL